MSADLFAEFGAEPVTSEKTEQSKPPTRPGVQQASSFAFFDGWSATPAAAPQSKIPPQPSSLSHVDYAPSQVPAAEDNDEWGDFEDSTPSAAVAATKQDQFAFARSHPSQASQNSWSNPQNVQDPSDSTTNKSLQPDETSWQKAPIIKMKKSADPSVLFDAEDGGDDDDEFGDFEGTQDVNVGSTAPVASSSALVDLMGDMSMSQRRISVQKTQDKAQGRHLSKSSFSAKKDPLVGFGTVAQAHKPPAVPVSSVDKTDNAWDTFDDWEASIPTKEPAKASSTATSTAKSTSIAPSQTPAPVFSSISDDVHSGEQPPTNVPPPGVLLSIFPSLFTEAQEKLFKPMAAQTLPMRNKLLAEPATIAYLQGYLGLANVAAHIIAGRKLRWKRDQHLSQGMRIGPASSRATSGMKLTGLDKGENMKEEREASDVVRVWKEQVGRLRHVVSGANQIKANTLGSVPDLQEVMPVKTLKQAEGGMPARQPCMMCGLKRDERVTTADLATDDSFGEWWIDQVNMHRGTSLSLLMRQDCC